MLIKCEQFMKKIGNVIVSSPNYKVEDCYNKFLTLSNVRLVVLEYESNEPIIPILSQPLILP